MADAFPVVVPLKGLINLCVEGMNAVRGRVGCIFLISYLPRHPSPSLQSMPLPPFPLIGKAERLATNKGPQDAWLKG